ncbi:protein-disulfide reductase DsbD [Thiomicrorhabdus sp. Kp2]|uniref:protein-disulfide reductase DsbD n=1 Tax=Thiomicrorhabdus sp. Kp2 TaxID=1123518 RepID=UPI000407FC89|nr:protein-disulfide reductase DsbD [Thiomicrorhabdus sp. Kp2]
MNSICSRPNKTKLYFLKSSLLALFTSLMVSLGLFASLNAHASDELLEVDQAFVLNQPTVNNQTIEVKWDIAEDYKLYKDKLSVNATNITLDAPQYSKSKTVDDALFGKSEVFQHTAVMTIPYTGDATQTELTVKYQGCADKLGVCYPPQTRTFTVDLPIQKTAATDSNLGSLSALNNYLQEDSGQAELLDADDAFAFTHKINANGRVELNWTIAHDYHLYQDKIKVSVLNGDATLGQLNLPKAELIDDELFGKTMVYHGSFSAELPVNAINNNATIQVEYQGCSAASGVCYPPVKKQITIDASNINTNATVTTSTQTATASVNAEALSESDQIADTLKNSSVWIVIATFFIFGLLLAFTPCVFPMIPILSSIIVGQGDQLTTRRAFVMSLVYVLAMSVTYTVAGVLAGMFGENLQAAFQNPWIIGSFAAIFLLLALSMFGFYELQLPNSLQTKLTNISNKQQGGTLTGVAVMGFLSALIVGPCVAPPLAGALIYIGQTGDALLGGTALFAMSMGMGLPLLLLGTSAGKLLPRAGAWMDNVKAVFGVMLIGVAIWMVERIVPAEVAMLSWAILFIMSAVYLGAFESTAEKSGWLKLTKGLGLALFLYGTMILIGLLGGSTQMFQPLKVFQGGGSHTQAQSEHLTFKTIKSSADLQAELAKGQPVMLDFYADWCVSCKEMEALTFTDSGVHSALKGVTLLQADVTANDDIDKTLMKQFGIIGPPAILFFTADGVEQKAQRVVGFKKADAFINNINKAYQ